MQAQVKNPFDIRYQDNIRGELTFIANNIVNSQTSSSSANTAYNFTGDNSSYNDDLNMQYIDIDGDPNTFSSSSATLTIPDPGCSRVRYAGLYWSAVYKYNDGNDSNSGRFNDYNQVKFRIPGGTYQDLTADEVLFNGFGDSDFGDYSPYAAYKDVTTLLTSLPDPNGEYFVANVRASTGDDITGGVSGGWTLVIVYENPTYPGKYITTYDGYAGIKSGQSVDIPYNGFITLPPPYPVNAKLAVAALEGDNRITGDQLSIKANSNSSFTTLGNSGNPNDNFFNSNITIDGAVQNARNPNSLNTLGWDVDLFSIVNPSQNVIPNNETGAILRASSTGDKYDIFFSSIDVEIIEPDIVLLKTVEDIGGNDIGGADVTLGQILEYVLTFQNNGNDDAINYSIRDILPINTNFISADFTNAPGTTFTHDPSTRQLLFQIPDNLVEKGDPAYTIRIRVQVVENCNELQDACANIIQNQAYGTYRGELNDNQISDDPSFAQWDACGFGTPAPANFLVDIDDCDFRRTEVLCGSNITLTAGNGFTSYQWRNGAGTVIGNTQSITVNTPGTYIVTKTAPAPCVSFDETIDVIFYGPNTTNPIIPFADEVVTWRKRRFSTT